MTGDTLIDKFITVIVSSTVGWLIASATKVSNAKLNDTMEQLEKRVLMPLVERMQKLEQKADSFVSRSEVKELIGDLKSSVRDSFSDLKGSTEARQLEMRSILTDMARQIRYGRKSAPRDEPGAGGDHE
jgi:hypothetical protein